MKIIEKYTLPQLIFILFLAIVAALNYHQLYKKISGTQQLRKKIPFQFAGVKFSGLNEVLKGEKYVGYYTDKDMEKPKNIAQFSQAQYVMIPTILDLNNTDHKYVLFDTSDEMAAFKKIKEMGALPLKKNQFGIILAQTRP